MLTTTNFKFAFRDLQYILCYLFPMFGPTSIVSNMSNYHKLLHAMCTDIFVGWFFSTEGYLQRPNEYGHETYNAVLSIRSLGKNLTGLHVFNAVFCASHSAQVGLGVPPNIQPMSTVLHIPMTQWVEKTYVPLRRTHGLNPIQTIQYHAWVTKVRIVFLGFWLPHRRDGS